MEFFAHSSNRNGSPWEPLAEHLDLVARRARDFGRVFGAGEEAYLAGLLHDLGKYSELFNRRLRNEESGLDHWTPGAYVAAAEYKAKALAAAIAIKGHHIGLQSGAGRAIQADLDLEKHANPETHPQGLRITEHKMGELLNRLAQDNFDLPPSPEFSLYRPEAPPVGGMLDARMLFSALVDADYLETEGHFEGNADGTKRYRGDGPNLAPREALDALAQRLNQVRRGTQASSDVTKMRERLLADCEAAAAEQPGLFTLTAPTGAGKTLSMLQFALRHADWHRHFRRIIVVIPFLTIIEQTVRVYRELFDEAFSPLFVLEDHSLAEVRASGAGSEADVDNENETRRSARLLAENWDAPIIITTSVKFFESMFSNRPSACRKLHRIANSIVLFDEVQTLPPRLAAPTLAALSRLSEQYGCTVVFSTATQPAFDHLSPQVERYAARGWKPRPIVQEAKRMFDAARRVEVDWRIDEPMSWERLAQELSTEDNRRVLCIVNLKRHAQKLTERLGELLDGEGLFHLSTQMCPAHRTATLNEVRKRLSDSAMPRCRLIATQCIEAGVDVDFPVAFRAFGPLDAIAQAAGRCNREGRLPGPGRLTVFVPEREYDKEFLYPPGGYKEAAASTETLLAAKLKAAETQTTDCGDRADLYDPDLYDRYYRLLYDLTSSTKVKRELEDALEVRSFLDVAAEYRLIDSRTINVVVPYEGEMKRFLSLRRYVEGGGKLMRAWIRDARPLTISLFPPKRDSAVWHYLEPVPISRSGVAADWFIYLNAEDYDPRLGLRTPDPSQSWLG